MHFLDGFSRDALMRPLPSGMGQADDPFEGIINKDRNAIRRAYGDRHILLVGDQSVRVRTAPGAGLFPGDEDIVPMNLFAPKNPRDINAGMRFKVSALGRGQRRVKIPCGEINGRVAGEGDQMGMVKQHQ